MTKTLYRKFSILLLLICLIGGATSCKNGQENHIRAKHIILLGFDGWGAYSVPKAEMPTVKEMMKNGSYTLTARSVLPSSSAVNWATMMMGAGPELHGFTDWDSQKPDLPSRVTTKEYGMFPTIFSLIRQQIPTAETGYFYQWSGMQYLMEKQAASVTAFVPDDSTKEDDCIQKAEAYIKAKKPLFTMIAINQPDEVGHAAGHDTPAYYDKLKHLDTYVAGIIQAAKDAGIYDNTIFILTADHGGINKGHGGKTMQEMQIPQIFFGKGIKKGYNIQESTMQYDMAATIAYMLNLKTPQVWTGRPIKSIFE